jgi:uroporphyrin-3 C-methyltransferase
METEVVKSPNKEQQQQEPIGSKRNSQDQQGGAGDLKTTRAPSGRWTFVFVIFTLLVVASALFFGYRHGIAMKENLTQLDQALEKANQQQNQLAEKIQQAHLGFERQQREIAIQGEALKHQAEWMSEQKEAAKEQETQLYRSLSELQTRMGGDTGQWRVAEAEYLMRFANHQLSLMGDSSTAVQALKSADERLGATADPTWSDVREVLAREMTDLKAVALVDTAGISAQLSALSKQVDELALQQHSVAQIPASSGKKDDQTNKETEPKNDSDQGIIDDFWQGFKSMLVIRRHDRPVTAVLAPEQRYFLVQNLRLKLETAKVALMGRNAPLYRDSLDAASQWVADYFETADPTVAAYTAQLKSLANRQIAPDLPDISGSLRALQAKRQALSAKEVK